MVRWDIYCSNCDKLTYDWEGSMYAIEVCPNCYGERTLASTSQRAKTQLFPFEARHIRADGQPMVIESMRQLREVERDYGVTLHAFSKDNINDVSPVDDKNTPRYRGHDEDIRAKYKDYR